MELVKKREITIEPLSRIEGHLGITAEIDYETSKYSEAHTYGTMFRGWEQILKNREPADAIWITQRTCGVCPIPHGLASAMAVDMAYGAAPPPMGIALRNLLLGAEQLYDSPLGCIILEGPDYSQSVVETSNPDWWSEAKVTFAEHSAYHGYNTIADIMKELNPIKGEIWRKSLEIEKIGRKMASLLGAKHPHVNTLVPGGIAKTLTISDLEQYVAMLSHHIAYTKQFVTLFDDLLDFVLEMGYKDCGATQTNLISYGGYEDPFSYNAEYESMTDYGKKRSVSPGVIIDGKLVTQDLVEINIGIQEMVDRSYYKEWDGPNHVEDSLGNALTKYHPWNKETQPSPESYKNWKGKYSWGTSVRWKDWRERINGELNTVELGPIARMWATAKGKLVPESTGYSIKFTVPKATVAGYMNADELEFEWKIPKHVNTIERIRARAYYHAYSAYIMFNQVLAGLELVKSGNMKVWNKYEKNKDGFGVGMHEAMRGGVAHWVVMKNKRADNYQIMAPSTWNAGPRLGLKDYSPYEAAIIGTPVTEMEPIKGVDVVRTIRSFDPCLACCVQVYRGDDEIIHIPQL